MKEKVLSISIMIPTYNEADNISCLILTILRKIPRAKILVVDDNSPDGTGEKVAELSKKFKNQVFLLTRTGKRGRGRAGIEGLEYILSNHRADIIVEMDADFSHHPKHLPEMLEMIKTADIVVGSRFVDGGKDKRGFIRHLITICGNFYIRKTLGISLKDCTSGFRIFRKAALQKVNLNKLISVGPAIVQEIIYKADLLGISIKEVPIIFVDRKIGKSKFNFKIMAQGVLMVLVLKFMMSDIWQEDMEKID